MIHSKYVVEKHIFFGHINKDNLIGSGIDVATGELVGPVPMLLLLQEFTLQNKWHVAKFLEQ
jgi:hypothetical protein